MHKGVILLTKASDRDEAVSQVESFLENYGDGDVWDWYVIGGRWSGTLNTKAKEFFVAAEKHFKQAYPENEHPFLTSAMVQEQSTALGDIWSSIGGVGLNPYARDNYANEGSDDDAIPLNDCIEVVKEWARDLDAEAETAWNKMLEAKKEGTPHDMSAYYAKRYAEAKYDEFCFDSNVYDIEGYTNDPAHALENADQYFAVMVDMHN